MRTRPCRPHFRPLPYASTYRIRMSNSCVNPLLGRNAAAFTVRGKAGQVRLGTRSDVVGAFQWFQDAGPSRDRQCCLPAR